MKKMTRRDYMTAIVDDQVKRGIVKEENREFQIKARLKGFGQVKPCSYDEAKKQYEEYFGK